jgi:ribosomal protein S12 methylthiotransferase accessory factor
VLTLCDQADVTVAVWDATSDFGIPVFECVIAERDDDPGHRLHAAAGMGCHPVREIALLRALTEAIQSRLTLITGSRDDLFRSDYERIRDADRQNDLRSFLQNEPARASFQDIATYEAGSFEEDVLWELGQLKSRGVSRVIVVELTREEFNIPVVRVVIPGLEGVDHVPGFIAGDRAREVLECAK